MVAGLSPHAALYHELKRLVDREQFEVRLGSWADPQAFGHTGAPGLQGRGLPSATRLRELVARAPAREWCGAQVYVPFGEDEVRAMAGLELVEVMMAVFEEVRPAMNLCMQVPV